MAEEALAKAKLEAEAAAGQAALHAHAVQVPCRACPCLASPCPDCLLWRRVATPAMPPHCPPPGCLLRGNVARVLWERAGRIWSKRSATPLHSTPLLTLLDAVGAQVLEAEKKEMHDKVEAAEDPQ